MTLTLELTTPERIVLKEAYDSVTLPTGEGEVTILPGHVPLVANLASGMVTARRGKEESYLAVTGGFLEVLPDGRLVVLADSADRAEELDLAAVEQARADAEALLKEGRRADDVAETAALAALERETARIKVARHHHSRRKELPNMQ
jgi:F-type H+-transporting ATPase subunit epsilon